MSDDSEGQGNVPSNSQRMSKPCGISRRALLLSLAMRGSWENERNLLFSVVFHPLIVYNTHADCLRQRKT